jgi:hypothetical protein
VYLRGPNDILIGGTIQAFSDLTPEDKSDDRYYILFENGKSGWLYEMNGTWYMSD